MPNPDAGFRSLPDGATRLEPRPGHTIVLTQRRQLGFTRRRNYSETVREPRSDGEHASWGSSAD
jgi:hypothetical protein